MAKNLEFENCKKILGLLLADLKGINWPKEMRMAKKILKEFPRVTELKEVSLTPKPTTLSWYLTEQGKIFLCKVISQIPLDLEERKTYTVESQRVGEDKEYEQAPQTILDFIKKYQ
jgi:hypothetical protein